MPLGWDKILAPRTRCGVGPGLRGWVLGLACAASLLLPAAADAQRESGFELEIAYTADLVSNVSGGLETGTRYLDNFDAMLTVALDTILAPGAGTVFVYGLYNNGRALSGDLAGDFQVASNIEAVRALRLYELWYEKASWDGEVSLRIGLYDLNSEFDVIETAGLFINSSHGIGAEFAQSGLNGPSIFPIASLAARLQWAPSPHWTVRAGVFDGVPGDPDDLSRTAIDLGDGGGALGVLEVDHSGESGWRAAAGYWRYTAEFDRLSGAGASAGNDGVYGLVEGPLLRRETGEPVMNGFLRVGVADPRFNTLGSYLGAGLRWLNLVPGRPDDSFGLAMAMANTGEAFRASVNAGTAAHREINLEATYRARIVDGLSLQPDLQYIINPGPSRTTPNAVVAGLRVTLSQTY